MEKQHETVHSLLSEIKGLIADAQHEFDDALKLIKSWREDLNKENSGE